MHPSNRSNPVSRRLKAALLLAESQNFDTLSKDHFDLGYGGLSGGKALLAGRALRLLARPFRILADLPHLLSRHEKE